MEPMIKGNKKRNNNNLVIEGDSTELEVITDSNMVSNKGTSQNEYNKSG